MISAIEPAIKLVSESYKRGEMKEANRLLHEFTQQVQEVKGEDRKRLIADLAAQTNAGYSRELFMLTLKKACVRMKIMRGTYASR